MLGLKTKRRSNELYEKSKRDDNMMMNENNVESGGGRSSLSSGSAFGLCNVNVHVCMRFLLV